jgi:hypothetical protein
VAPNLGGKRLEPHFALKSVFPSDEGDSVVGWYGGSLVSKVPMTKMPNALAEMRPHTIYMAHMRTLLMEHKKLRTRKSQLEVARSGDDSIAFLKPSKPS